MLNFIVNQGIIQAVNDFRNINFLMSDLSLRQRLFVALFLFYLYLIKEKFERKLHFGLDNQ